MGLVLVREGQTSVPALRGNQEAMSREGRRVCVVLVRYPDGESGRGYA